MFWIDVGKRRARLQSGGDDGVDCAGRRKGEHRAPFRRAERRLALAKVGALADRLRAFQIVNIDDLATFRHRQMHRFVGRFAQGEDVRTRLRRHVHALAHKGAEAKQC